MNSKLDDLIVAAERRFPGLAYAEPNRNGHYSRAESAGALVEAGACKYIGEQNGDHWKVAGKMCSIARKSCECFDNHAPRHLGGKLCKHRLAAMFAKRLDEAKADHIRGIFSGAQGDLISIRADVYYQNKEVKITGYRNGGRWVYFEKPADRISVTVGGFQRLMESSGWEIETNSKQGGFSHVYTLRPIQDGEARPAFTVMSQSAEQRARRQFNHYAEAMQAAA